MEISWVLGDNDFIAETRGALPSIGDEVAFHDHAKVANLKERDRWFKVVKIIHVVSTMSVSTACARDEIVKTKDPAEMDDGDYADAAIKAAEQLSGGRLMTLRKGELICGVQKAEVYLELRDKEE